MIASSTRCLDAGELAARPCRAVSAAGRRASDSPATVTWARSAGRGPGGRPRRRLRRRAGGSAGDVVGSWSSGWTCRSVSRRSTAPPGLGGARHRADLIVPKSSGPDVTVESRRYPTVRQRPPRRGRRSRERPGQRAACPARRPSRRPAATRRRRRRPPPGRAAAAASPAGTARAVRRSAGPGSGSCSGSPSSACSRFTASSNRRVGAAGELDLGGDGGQRVRRAAHRPQHVEGDDVARALPDRVQRRLPVEPGQPGLLDVAVAAEHLHGLGRRRPGCACRPRTSPRRRPAAGRPLAGVQRRGQPHAERGRRLALHAPGRPARSASAAGRPAARRTPGGAGRGGPPGSAPPAPSAAEPSTQSSRVVLTISMIAGTPRPGSPTSQPVVPSNSTSLEALDRSPSLSLSRCSAEHVARAVGQHARDEEAGDALVELGQHQEQVAHRRGGEPLVPGQRVAAVGPGTARVVLARTSEPPCFSVMPMPAISPALGRRVGQPELVRRRGQPGLVAGGEFRGRGAAPGPRRRSS